MKAAPAQDKPGSTLSLACICTLLMLLSMCLWEHAVAGAKASWLLTLMLNQKVCSKSAEGLTAWSKPLGCSLRLQ